MARLPDGRPRRPRLRPDVVVAVFAGGCLGGWARYGITSNWPARAGFPWATFAVNVTGAFVLTVVIVAAANVVPSRYLRPLVGTGFCGAFTTFSSVVVSADQLFMHRHAGTAVSYVIASIVAGLAAAWLGLVLGRAAAGPRTGRERRTT